MIRILSILALACLLASCGGDSKRHAKTDFPEPDEATCRAGILASAGHFRQASIGGSGACAVSLPVQLERSTGLDFSPGLSTSCAMALAWFSFEPEAEELARRHLGSGIAALHHYGSYSCRQMTGNSGRPSLHASARALDISGFELDDGRLISVKNDWNRGAAGRFLRAFAEAACERFGVVLTPAHDRLHHDHVHIDIGPWRLCKT